MGRGQNWGLRQTTHLASAMVQAAEDPVAGVYQKSSVYAESIYNIFLSTDPSPQHDLYRKLQSPVVFRRTKEVSAEVMKFHEALAIVRASKPTGCNEDNILSMAIAIHLDEQPTTKMDYDFKDLSHTTWVCYGAWKVLRGHPKWQGEYGPIITGTTIGQDAESCGMSEDDDDETLSIVEGESGTKAKLGVGSDAVEGDGRWTEPVASVNTTDFAEPASALPPRQSAGRKPRRRAEKTCHCTQ
jgi:hypothetical protein